NGGAWYCVVVLANSDQTLIARPTKDGYVLASYNIGTPTTRGANTAAQVTSTVAGIKFAYKITDVTAEGPTTDLTSTLASLSLGDTTGQSTCQLNGGAWYCPAILANSDQTLVASPALDGYVQKSYDLTTGNTRAGHSTAQVVDTVAGVQYAFKIDTVTTETIGTNIAGSLTGLAVGDDSAQDSCTKSGSTWYCRVLTTNSTSDSNMRTIPTLDGYVQKSHPLPTGNARSTNTIAQRTPTVDDVLYAYKITGISTETIAADITTSVSPLTVGDASGQNTCTRSGSTWYCPVQTTNSNAGSIIATPTLDGYVQKSYNIGTQTTRTANTANQVTSALQNVQYAYKITSVTAEGPGTGLTSSLTSLVIGDGSGQDACTLSSGDWYCSVRTAYSDQTPLFARPTKDGYVLANYNIGAQTTRSVNTAAQVATTVSDVRFTFTVTSVTTEGPGTALTSSITTMTVGDETGKDACLLNGGAWYCPVLLANSDGTLKVRPVKDGYVEEDHTYTGAGTRTAYDAAQSTGTVAGFRFSYTVQVEDQRTTAGPVTVAAVTAGASDVGCTFNVDRYYCPIVLADDTGADADVDAAKAGYVTTHWDTALAAGRTQHTDSPLAVTVTDMPFAQKL
ncbi:MAG: hypothetical protein QF415_17470, partial [Candidatus Undinarchaeales archaeon]|nr:hypothetical protein [Candidatus Undinarchaeales archaeon]